MRLDLTIAYAPTLTYEATRLLPPGTTLKLGTKMAVEVPEASNEDAPVAFTFRDGGAVSEWRRRGSQWLRPLGTETAYPGLRDPRPIDAKAFAGLAAAGYVPARDEMTGIARLVPGDAVQAVAAGEALLGMVERRNPSSPSQGRNRNIIDSGDVRRAEAEARRAWASLGAVIVDGSAWHAVSEPVLALDRGGRILALPARSAMAQSFEKLGRTYQDLSSALDAAEAETGRRPSCEAEWAEEQASSPAP